MTQKQALKSLLDTAFGVSNKNFKLVFITKWLEDINWHMENKIVWNRLGKHQQKFIEVIDDYEFGDSEDGMKHGTNKEVVLGGPYGFRFTRDMLNYEIKKTNFYSAFSMIYGWGIDNSFEHTTGEKFVDELLELLETYELRHDEKGLIYKGTYDECWLKLIKIQPFSTEHAIKDEGYSIKKK